MTVITEKLIDDARLDTLKEALHYTAGITFSATENGTDQDIRIRGFPVATTGDLLIDGMRDPSQYERDTFNLDRVEVMRGSASMLFGRGSTGGVINQVTKKPLLADQTDVVGSVGTDGLLPHHRRLQRPHRRGSGAARQRHGDQGGQPRRQASNAMASPRATAGASTRRDEFNVGLFHLNSNNVPRNGVGYLGGNVARTDPRNFYGTGSDYVDGSATYASFSHMHRFDGGGELRSQVRSGTFDRAQWSSVARFGTTNGVATTPATLGDTTLLTRGSLTPRKDNYRTTYVQSDYSNKFGWLGLRHEVLAGVDAAHEEATRFQNAAGNVLGTRPATTVGTPDDGARLTGTGNVPAYRESSNYRGQAFGVYAQDLVQIAPMWKLLGGVRWDRFEATTGQVTYAADGSVASRPATELSYPSLWSYRAGVLFQPTTPAPITCRTAPRSTRRPTRTSSRRQQNANTPAEKSRNVEVGAKLDWLDGKLSTRAALFRTEKFHERTTDADFAGDRVHCSRASATRTGLELDVVGRLAPAWEVYLSYAFIPTATIDAAGSSATAQASVGQRVGLTPRHTAAPPGSATRPRRSCAWPAGCTGRARTSRCKARPERPSRTARAPGYGVVDLMAEYKATPDLFVQLNVTNLANRTYGDQLYPGFAIPGLGRSVVASVAYRY